MLLFSCHFTVTAANEFQWQLPPGFPVPKVPADNPMNNAKVSLGRQLFFDTRLSINNTFACASCHKPELAFTDGLARAVGVHGDLHPRSSMSLVNVAYNTVFGWASREIDSLEKQILVPMFNQNPPELGLSMPIDQVLDRFRGDSSYLSLFRSAFGEEADISLTTMSKAIAAFERTLILGDSAYDRYVFLDEKTALTETQKAGMALFYSERLACSHCHGGFNFSNSIVFENSPETAIVFHNTKVLAAYNGDEKGLANETKATEDEGYFRAPSLRNITLTAPYMHDGSFATLEEVLNHYQHTKIQLAERKLQFSLTAEETAQVIAFLHSLTDSQFYGQSKH